ncbi:MAG: thioredoxin domain-containing protein [Vicinamibacterales bacterium]
MNRLADERSPYLLQHATNPVDWYPWGEAAFARARAEDKPIFLSVGYSTCHWCHVMEHESFENPDIARMLNEFFVSVKVDREERPDVDRVYMAFVQGTTGSGGWPMSVWLTPDLKPFYGGTYFPPTSKWNRPGFIDVLQQLHRSWTENRNKIEESAGSVTEQLRGASLAAPASEVPSPEVLAHIASEFRSAFDAKYAGFGSAPKFPRPAELLFLLREHARTGNADAKEMVLSTLRAMAVGGMRDHIGGGFHRYSVDPTWRVPHFEKMLYDQAQLTLAYLEGAQVSGDRFHLDVAEDTLRYVMREMTGEGGGFYSAEDADSVPPEDAGASNAHKMEGAFYLWRAEEVNELLGDAAVLVSRRFGIVAEGNAPVDPQQEFVGKNLFYVARAIGDLAEDFNISPGAVNEVLNDARLRLFQARLARPRPHLDDKVLTSWNGLMIAAFARAARVIRAQAEQGNSAAAPYLDAARRAASFIFDTMWRAESRTLLRRYRDGRAEIDGYAEDYAYLIFGLLELFQADPRGRWLEWAIALQARQDELFWDEGAGGWFSTTGQDPTVLVRMKEDYDGAEPSASSVSVLNLMVLSHLHAEPAWTDKIERTLRLYGPRLEQIGRAVPMMASALATHASGLDQVVVVGDGPKADALLEVATLRYRPFSITLGLSLSVQQELVNVAPFLALLGLRDGEPAAYVCRDFACRAPVTDPIALARTLNDE